MELSVFRLAELVLRAAIRLQPHDPVSWTYLGLVMEVINHYTYYRAYIFNFDPDPGSAIDKNGFGLLNQKL